MTHLFVVDDDSDFRETPLKALKSQGYRAAGIADPDSLASVIAIYRSTVVLLDMMFESGADSLEVCKSLRTWSSILVLVLSMLNDEDTKVRLLDVGADDYLAKPFGINEFLAWIRAVERRIQQRPIAASPIFTVGDPSINFFQNMEGRCNRYGN